MIGYFWLYQSLIFVLIGQFRSTFGYQRYDRCHCHSLSDIQICYSCECKMQSFRNQYISLIFPEDLEPNAYIQHLIGTDSQNSISSRRRARAWNWKTYSDLSIFCNLLWNTEVAFLNWTHASVMKPTKKLKLQNLKTLLWHKNRVLFLSLIGWLFNWSWPHQGLSKITLKGIDKVIQGHTPSKTKGTGSQYPVFFHILIFAI